MILNRFHHSVFAKSAKRAPGTKTGVFPLLRFRSFSFLLFALVLKPRMLYRLLLERFRMTPFSVFPLKTMRFQMSPFSNHSTLNSVFKCLRFRSFSMETPTQKRRHSTPFSYENGVMETGPINGAFTYLYLSTPRQAVAEISSNSPLGKYDLVSAKLLLFFKSTCRPLYVQLTNFMLQC